ncbi:MAG: hypothetical protein AVDCRST_MAG56-3467 [uncultured Cytophagales bacterium]|uniref:Uncharacterized protein n=1 Tax=uncultured Cytophagales bacterium TaxID=158755 RepID=A0A6J4JEU7_9SPHI|nr:MAG: hypothetical protein AVDCRST_MAG56-3467 [uncultured Cytophagales bacterium]
MRSGARDENSGQKSCYRKINDCKDLFKPIIIWTFELYDLNESVLNVLQSQYTSNQCLLN